MEINMDYSQLEKLIPKDKFDFEPFPVLLEISEDVVGPILPNLLFGFAERIGPKAEE